MHREECDRIRSKSAGAHSKSHPWNSDYEAMCLKSVIKKMSKTISKKQNAHAERLSYASVAAEDTGEGQTITLGSTDFLTLTKEEETDEKGKEPSEAGSGQSNKPSPIEIDKENAPRPNRSIRGRAQAKPKEKQLQQEAASGSSEESSKQGVKHAAA